MRKRSGFTLALLPCGFAGIGSRLDIIFDVRSQKNSSHPIKVRSQWMCDFRRTDWESRWSDWSSGRNPYLNLFLCEEHARRLGLMRS
jgi:hypothetical protein